METIIAAIIVGVLLLWGGVFGLLQIVEMFERKHFLGLGAYATVVAALIMGLVLFNAHERQKEHRRELQDQVNEITKRLSDLSEKLVSQLAEKADLTASEFEIRSRLQNEKMSHQQTRDTLADLDTEHKNVKVALNKEQIARLSYQKQQNAKFAEQFEREEQRYQGILDFLEIHKRTIQGIQKQIVNIQDETTKLNTQLSALSTNQNSLIGKISSSAEIQDLNTQKIDALARNQASLYDDLSRTMAQVDSLYTWKRK